MAPHRETWSMTLRLSEEEHEALKGAAHAFGSSMNDVVRRALREFLSGSARREEFDELLKRTHEQYGRAFEKLADM
jgi:uncharacterized protein (DUF1778 family)